MDYVRNCIDLENDLDTPVYRVFSSDRFFETFVSRTLALVRPHKWDDPFENFLYQVKIESPDGNPVSVAGLRRKLFGQCWSLNDESDATWRIYSHAKDGIKCRSTVRKVFEAIYNPGDKYASLRYFIGRVAYKSEGELLDLFADSDRYISILTDTSGRGPVIALLSKRNEFRHEQEVRLIYQSPVDVPDDVHFFPLTDPNDLFDELVFDPRMSAFYVKAFTNYLRSLGYTKPISQSRLYRLPEIPHKIIL
ncbi:MAG: DUF2971 domain-containing protein [Acidobacteriota bacterium]|nr:DUF2971 domain-containing protein [Acidobacteriota bacterium]